MHFIKLTTNNSSDQETITVNPHAIAFYKKSKHTSEGSQVTLVDGSHLYVLQNVRVLDSLVDRAL